MRKEIDLIGCAFIELSDDTARLGLSPTTRRAFGWVGSALIWIAGLGARDPDMLTAE